MAVQRCPSCGRAWDGALCFACGQEAGASPKAAAAASPPTSPPSAPLPVFGAGLAVPAPLVHLAPVAAVLPPAPVPPLVPVAPPAPPVAAVVPAPAPPPPPRTTTATTTTARTEPSPWIEGPEDLAQRAASTRKFTGTIVTKPSTLLRLWRSPTAFGAVFVAGFALAFGMGALVLWGQADIEGMLAKGQVDAALTLLESKKQPTLHDAVWKGHALFLKGNRDGMLKSYQAAGTARDERALQNTLDALGVDKVASLAVKTLEDWPGADIDERLMSLTSDGSLRRRHAALEALNVRPSAGANLRLTGAVRVAVADLRADVCEAKQAGLVAIAAFVVRPEAAPLLKAAGAWKALYEQDSDVVFAQHRCLDAALVKRTLASLSVIEL